MVFHRRDGSTFDWNLLEQFSDCTIFQTREWMNFLADDQGATPIVAELREDNQLRGYFTGLLFRRMGVPILGSPFPGWATPFMGFNLLPGVPTWKALQALERFAFHDLRCLHVEIADLHMSVYDAEELGFTYEWQNSYVSDLTRTEEQMFADMTSACRRCIRKATRCGVSIEEADDERFAEDYYTQLRHTFARKNLVPTFKVSRIRKMIEQLKPTGRTLLLRALDPQGNCIATSMYVGLNKRAELWGTASLRSGHRFSPNELMHWYGLKYWKARGSELFDWGGDGTYKEKYGVKPIRTLRLRKSRFQLIQLSRTGAQQFVQLKQRILGSLQAPRRGLRGHCLPPTFTALLSDDRATVMALAAQADTLNNLGCPL